MRRVSEAHLVDTDLAPCHKRYEILNQYGVVVIPKGAPNDAIARDGIEMLGIDVGAAKRNIEEAHGRTCARDRRRSTQQTKIGLVCARHDSRENSGQREGDDRMHRYAKPKDGRADKQIARAAAIEPAQQEAEQCDAGEHDQRMRFSPRRVLPGILAEGKK